ncbi:MAG: lysylphosphatidylglycerol synthase transmembrane domain-containing protein [Acidobacteriota bacterium]|nr:lysylphosphatidylglycerol synthase transmembrane domain-containing protein [Acidobacteriota bacterium]
MVRLAITITILFFLSTRIDMAATARAVADVSRWHLGVVLVMVGIDRAVMFTRWWLLLRASGIAISAGDAARLFLVSSFVGSFLPAGVGGDAARAYGLAQGPTTGSEALASVAVDRMLGVLSLVAMGLVGLLAWTPEARNDWRLAAALAVLVAASVAPFWANQWLRWIVPSHRHQRSVTRRVLKLSDAVGRYRNRRGVLVHVMAWSLVVQVLRIVQAYILALGLGMTVPFGYFLLFMPAGLLMLLLPVSISGFGAPQAAIVWMLQPAGVPESTALALSTLIVLTGLAGNLPGLLLWLKARQPRQT